MNLKKKERIEVYDEMGLNLTLQVQFKVTEVFQNIFTKTKTSFGEPLAAIEGIQHYVLINIFKKIIKIN